MRIHFILILQQKSLAKKVYLQIRSCNIVYYLLLQFKFNLILNSFFGVFEKLYLFVRLFGFSSKHLTCSANIFIK